MATLADLTTRVQMLLQDETGDAWQAAQIRRELDHSLLAYARSHAVQDVVWCQAVQGQTHYPLNALSLHITAGKDNSGTAGNLLTLTNTLTNFTTLTDPVAVGDRIRNLHDGSTGSITAVAATVLTCAAGFSGGMANAITTGARYVIERPLTQHRIVAVHAVLYNGIDLWPMTVDAMDRQAPAWELQATGPRYWSTDQEETPSVIRIHPAPLMTGSSVPIFPMNPLAQRWEENCVLVLSTHPQQSLDGEEIFHCLDWCADVAVWETVARLAGFPGQWQALSLSAGAKALAALTQSAGVR